jgi:hypothetical protein
MGGVRDGYSNFLFYCEIPPGGKNAAETGRSVDRRGFETVTFVVNVENFSLSNGSVYSNFFVRMQHGESNATTGVVAWSNCQASHMLFDATMSGLVTANQSHGLWAVGSCGSGPDEGVWLHFGLSQSLLGSMESRAYAVGYVGTRRWVRLMLSQSTAGDQSTVELGAIAILGLPGQWPVNLIQRTNS